MPFKIDKRIVELVESELPGFITESYPNFVFFMQAYFEWLESRIDTISTVIVNQQGEGYEVDQEVQILQQGSDAPASIKITDVYAGKVLDIVLINPGKNYIVEHNVKTSDSSTGHRLTVDILSVVRGAKGAFYGAQQLKELQDIDKTEIEFFTYFEKEFMPHIPRSTLCDRVNLLKNIKQFYKTRGNEASYRLLFRILYMNEISFYYPTVDIIRPDEGKWVQDTSIVIRVPTNTKQFDPTTVFFQQRVKGLTSGAYANVDHIIKYVLPSSTHYEIIFEKNSLYKSFIPFEKISLISTFDYIAEVLPVLTDITITDSGLGYLVGETITITNDYTPMSARVSDVGEDGQVQAVSITGHGTGYPSMDPAIAPLPTVTFSSNKPSQAKGVAVLDAVFISPGYYDNSDGMCDNIEKLRDDYYYQEYSYVISSRTNLTEWSDVIKKLVHPAGCLAFGNYQIYPEVLKGGIKSVMKPEFKIVYSYLTGTKVNAKLAVPNNSVFEKIIHDTKESRARVGPTLGSINRDAYRNMPTQRFPSDSSYWNNYANYSLADLADVSLYDLKYREYRRI